MDIQGVIPILVVIWAIASAVLKRRKQSLGAPRREGTRRDAPPPVRHNEPMRPSQKAPGRPLVKGLRGALEGVMRDIGQAMRADMPDAEARPRTRTKQPPSVPPRSGTAATPLEFLPTRTGSTAQSPRSAPLPRGAYVPRTSADLRKAIVWAEIIGPPVSLRE